MKYLFLSTLLVLGSFQLMAQNADDIVGIWKHSDGKLMVKIDRMGSSYQGRITWLAIESDSNGKPLLDVNNPVPRMRNMPLKGNRVLKQLTYNQSKDVWENGTYYIFSEGNIYNCRILMPNKKKIKISRYSNEGILVQEEIWTRVK